MLVQMLYWHIPLLFTYQYRAEAGQVIGSLHQPYDLYEV